MRQRYHSLVDCSVIHPTTISATVLDALANMQHLQRLAFNFSASEDIFGEPLPNGLDLPALRNLLLTNQGVQHLCFDNCESISSELLNIICNRIALPERD